MSGKPKQAAAAAAGADGPSPAAQAAAEEACATMQAALAALKDSRDASCPAPSRAQLQAAAGQLKMEVSKVGLLYNAAQPPSDAEAAALLSDFQGAAATLCMAYTGLAAAPGAGPTLRASLAATATSVVEACVALLRGAVGGGARDAQLMLLCGFALEMLEAAGRAPLDDRAAIGRAITQVLKQLTDAQKELAEAIREGEEAATAAAGDGDNEGGSEEAGADGADDVDAASEGSDFGFGFQQEAFTPAQLAVARAAQALLGAAAGMARAVAKVLLSERDGLAPEAVEGWESVLYHVKALAPVCDDLAAAVYPPQDGEELGCTAEALATSCGLLQDECPLPADAEAGGAAAAALRAAMEAVEAAQAALGEQLAAAGAADDAGADDEA